MKYLAIIFTVVCAHSQVLINHYLSGANTENNNLLPQLVAFWSLDEASGYAVDSNTNAFHLTEIATVLTNTGKIDGARNFAGTLNGFWTNNATFAELGTNEFTIALWFNPNGAVEGWLMSRGDFNGGFSWGIQILTGPSTTYVDVSDVVFSVNGFPLNELRVPMMRDGETMLSEWHFVYIRRTGDVFDMGLAVPGEDTITFSDSYNPGGTFLFGTFGTDFALGTGLFDAAPLQEWEGGLDHVGIWQRALSDCEILKLLRLRKHSQFDSDPCN